MATYTKEFLSASSSGGGVDISATASPGTLVHTAVSGLSDKDEVFLYIVNMHTADVDVTIEFAGTAIQKTIPFKEGLFLEIPGFPINNGETVRVFASVASVVSVLGWVNRITA